MMMDDFRYEIAKIEKLADGRYLITAKEIDPTKRKHRNFPFLTDNASMYRVGMEVIPTFAPHGSE